MFRRIRIYIERIFLPWWKILPLPVRRLTKVVLAGFFFILGIVGIFIPVMPQIAFFLLGLTLLSSESTRAREFLRKTKRWAARKRRELRRRRNHG
jgi:uncharacterized membrane protein YbaN (DUF454 family)